MNLPGGVTLQPSDVLMVPNTDPDVLDQYICETSNGVGSERGFIYIYTIDPGCRCRYGVVIGVLIFLCVLCTCLLYCWTKGIVRKGKCLGQMESSGDFGEVKENEYVDVSLEAEESREQRHDDRMTQDTEERSPEASGKSTEQRQDDRMNQEAEKRSPEASGKSTALVTSFSESAIPP